jgi:bacterioferritin
MPHFVEDIETIRERAIQKIEDGPVTSTYGLDHEKTIGILNDALATEIVCVLRYMHHYFMATGVHGRAAAGEFKEHADAEREHADEIAERIQQLGGKPDFDPRSLLERSVAQYVEGETLADMIREDLIAERIVIDVYRNLIKFFGNDDPTTRTILEGILEDEEEHANDLADLLYVVNPSTGETETQDPGTEIGRNERETRLDRGQRSKSQPHSEQSRSDRHRSKTQSQRPPAERPRGSRSTQLGEEAVSEQRDRDGRHDRGDSRLSRASNRERPLAGRREPARAAGTTGRVMAHHGRNEVVHAEDDITVGGRSDATRSPKVVEKTRKKRAA